MLGTTRQGLLGRCVACQQSITSHFDITSWEWIGCTAMRSDTMVYTLVPLPLHPMIDPSMPTEIPLRKPMPPSGRTMARAAYRPLIPHDTNLDALPVRVSPNRRRVLKAVMQFYRDRRKQPISREIVILTGLSRGIVSEALNWLRKHNLIIATDMTDVRLPSIP